MCARGYALMALLFPFHTDGVRITYIVYILHCRVLSDLARVRLTNFLKLPTYTQLGATTLVFGCPLGPLDLSLDHYQISQQYAFPPYLIVPNPLSPRKNLQSFKAEP